MSQEQMDYLLKYYSGYLGAGQSFDVIDVATQKWGYDTIMNHDNPKCDSSGTMASLYLVARSGWAKSVQVWNVAAKLEGNSCNTGGRMAFFNKAFQQVYGQDLASFYAEVTPVLKHIYDDRQAILLSSDAIQPAGTVKIQLTESCHGYGVSSTLQRLTNGQWLDIASGLGWAVSSCAGKYLPWTYATVVSGDQMRWHVFAPGVWDWYSTPYRYSS